MNGTKNNMRFAFFGTPQFAVLILEKLIAAGFRPDVVVCNPDRPVGRRKAITSPPVKIFAETHGIQVRQPEKLNAKDSLSTIEGMDFAIVTSYANIIPPKIIKSFRLGMAGVHPSLLPKYRGASPIQSVILGGEKKTGVTLYLLDQEVDHGPIIAKSEIEVSGSETYGTLHDKLAERAAESLIEVLPKFMHEEITPVSQNETEATYTKKFTTQDGFVDLEKDNPMIIERKVRALNPEPGVWTFQQVQGRPRRMKIFEASLEDGKIKLKKIQFEGKKPEVL